MKYIEPLYTWIKDTFFTGRALVTYLVFVTLLGSHLFSYQHGRTIEARHAEINGAHLVLALSYVENGKVAPEDLNVFISQKHADVSPFSWWQLGTLFMVALIFSFITFLRMVLYVWTEKCVEQERDLRTLKTLLKDGVKE
jgi:hypothetical protein